MNSNMGDPIIYWILKIGVLFLLIYSGYHISHKQLKKMNRYTLAVIISFALVEGLRWMRGVDYEHYYNDITTNLKGPGYVTPNPELLYKTFINIVNYIDLPYWLVFVIYSALLIFSFTLIVQKFPKSAVWAYPIFYVYLCAGYENHIRQYIAIPFIIIAYKHYLENNKKKTFLFLAIAPFIHFSAIYCIPIFLLFMYFKPKDRKYMPIILLAIYIVIFFSQKNGLLDSISNQLNQLTALSDMRSQSYLENADRWFGSGNIDEDQPIASFINQTISFIINIVIIYFGYKVIKKRKELVIPYYFSFFAIIILELGNKIEIFGRIGEWYSYFIPFLCGLIMCDVKNIKLKYLIAILYVGYFYYGCLLSGIGKISTVGYSFVWDKI